MVTEWDFRRIDLSGGDQTIEAVPCLVKGVYINVATSAHAVEIKNGSNNAHTIPASATAGNAYDFSGDAVRYDTSLVVSPNGSGTGSISVQFVRMEEAHA